MQVIWGWMDGWMDTDRVHTYRVSHSKPRFCGWTIDRWIILKIILDKKASFRCAEPLQNAQAAASDSLRERRQRCSCAVASCTDTVGLGWIDRSMALAHFFDCSRVFFCNLLCTHVLISPFAFKRQDQRMML